MVDDFSERLIKGKIVETIFRQMFLDSKKFNVHPFGYENVIPTLSQSHHDDRVKQMISNLRHMPDFILTPKDVDGVYVVEVKYQHELNMERLCEFASKLYGNWTCPWLFVATQEKFYFDSCSNIIEKNSIKELNPQDWIDMTLQEKYHSLLLKFIRD